MVSNSRLWIAGLVGLVMLFALSCGSGDSNPLAPTSDFSNNSGLGLTGESGDGSTGHSSQAEATSTLWGMYDVTYDTASNQFEIVPMRTSQVTFNMTLFLQPPDGNPANLSIGNLDNSLISEGKLSLDVSITHPVPIPRFIGFDTYGVLIGNGSIPFDDDPDAVFAGPDDLRLLNADGYTRWRNPVEFSDPGIGGFTELAGFLRKRIS